MGKKSLRYSACIYPCDVTSLYSIESTSTGRGYTVAAISSATAVHVTLLYIQGVSNSNQTNTESGRLASGLTCQQVSGNRLRLSRFSLTTRPSSSMCTLPKST